jgi:hypothetical protein
MSRPWATSVWKSYGKRGVCDRRTTSVVAGSVPILRLQCQRLLATYAQWRAVPESFSLELRLLPPNAQVRNQVRTRHRVPMSLERESGKKEKIRS